MARSGSGGDGKSIAQQMNFSSDTLALLQQWYAAHRPDQGVEVMTGTGADMAQYLAKTRDARGALGPRAAPENLPRPPAATGRCGCTPRPSCSPFASPTGQ